MARPRLIIVSGPPGSGKTTLAHAIAVAMGCPAICRDEIKEGMVHAQPDFTPTPGDVLTERTYFTFFQLLHVILGARATVVAEAAFQDQLWRPRLEGLAEIAELRIIECKVDEEVRRARRDQRDTSALRRAAHVGVTQSELEGRPFEWISLEAPKLRVDTTDGLSPPLPEIVEFINS
ncbi:MAG: ATP-binding protein [Chloroflexi bacterium]|nr:ATP-binding protein [Chloroflexota bacterium]MBV9898993.1 ATP-binding protein [Chloroflexota bacterium]